MHKIQSCAHKIGRQAYRLQHLRTFVYWCPQPSPTRPHRATLKQAGATRGLHSVITLALDAARIPFHSWC